MGNNNNKNKNKNTESKFLRFTGQQLLVNLEKYEKIPKTNPLHLVEPPNTHTQKLENSQSSFHKRLNSIDTSMLEDVAYTVLDDENLKLEKKIEDTEKILKELTEKLIVADAIEDIAKKNELLNQKAILLQKRDGLLQEYKSKNVYTQLATIYIKIVKLPQYLNEKLKKKLKKFIRNSTILKKITPLMRSITVRETLHKLKKINKSVDELVTMKVPFGEQEEKYDALINHLSRATVLHAKISKELQK